MFVTDCVLASRTASRMAASSVCTVEQSLEALNDFVCVALQKQNHMCRFHCPTQDRH